MMMIDRDKGILTFCGVTNINKTAGKCNMHDYIGLDNFKEIINN